jgi:hypothetical protein
MKTTQTNPLLVAIIGFVLCIMAVAGIFFGLIKPTQESTATAQARLDAAQPDSTLPEQNKALKALNAANLQVKMVQNIWAQKDAALMPRYDVSNRFGALKQLTTELTQNLGPNLERHARHPGVVSTSTFNLPAPPVNPNDITNAPVVIPLGTLTDVGPFRSILTNVYNWQYFNRLVLIDDLALHGNSPYMQGTYTATLFLFPQHDTKLPPIIAAAGGGTATTTGRGPSSFGGPPGMPGGPGMGGMSSPGRPVGGGMSPR